VIPKKNHLFEAVLSLCDIFELSATRDEVLDLMGFLARADHEPQSPRECPAVVEFIEQKGGKSVPGTD
jgi:hypothetical protein